jgi:hypothetical protein
VAAALAFAVGAGCASESEPPAAAPARGDGPVVNEDHWHAAVGLYVCDDFLPDVAEFETALGIHTHGDGVIHVHPFSQDGAGENATLGLYLAQAGIEAGGATLTVDGETYDACGDGGPVAVRIARWDDVAAGGSPDRVVDDPDDLRFTATGEGYTVALVPEGTDIPAPPSADELAALDGPDGAGTGTTVPVEEPPQAGGQGPVSGPGGDVADGFLPVVTEVPSPGPGAVCATGHVGSLDTGCYELGEDGAVGLDAVASAEAALIAGQWSVQLTMSEDGIGAFNRLAGSCYEVAPSCPAGRVAVVVGGRVISAPAIATPEFEADQIQISGGFSAAEAETIAEAMTG